MFPGLSSCWSRRARPFFPAQALAPVPSFLVPCFSFLAPCVSPVPDESLLLRPRTTSVRITRKERTELALHKIQQARQKRAAFEQSEAARRKQWQAVAKSVEEVQRAKRTAARKALLMSLPITGEKRAKEQRNLLHRFRPSCMPHWGKSPAEVEAELVEQKRKDERRARKKERRRERKARMKQEGSEEEDGKGDGRGDDAGAEGGDASMCGYQDQELMQCSTLSAMEVDSSHPDNQLPCAGYGICTSL